MKVTHWICGEEEVILTEGRLRGWAMFANFQKSGSWIGVVELEARRLFAEGWASLYTVDVETVWNCSTWSLLPKSRRRTKGIEWFAVRYGDSYRFSLLASTVFKNVQSQQPPSLPHTSR